MTIDTAASAQCGDATHPVAKPDAGHGRKSPGWLAGLGVVAFLSLAPGNAALAATAPNLGTTSTFGVVSSTFTNSNTTPQTIINGGVCYTTPPVTPPLVITGATVTPCLPAVGSDQALALADLNSQACVSLGAGAVVLDSIIVGANPPGTIPPGCYSSGGAMNITASTTVTLNGAGVYIFRPGGALTTGANSTVNLTGGAIASNVFWAPAAATTLGANASLSVTPTFVGTIIDDAGISIGHFANLAGRALSFNGTVTTDAVTITAPATGVSTVTVTKISNGGVGTFSFTGSNGLAAQSITTLTAGTGVTGATQTLTTAGAASTTITEATPPAGYTLASISCSGLGAGGVQTPNLATRTVTLDAAATVAGSAIACTFTNTFTPAATTVTVTKVSNGGVGTFGFTGSNGFANQSITTLTSGAGVTGATQTLTAAGTSTTITESAPPAGYALASISCSGLGAGGVQTPNLATRTVTLDAAATAAGAAIACTFTNTFTPAATTVTVTKVSNGGVGTFSFTGSNGFANQSITTLTSGAGVAGATQTLTAAGASTTITESAPPAGYTLASVSCSGLGAGGVQTPNLATRTVTLDAAATVAGSAIACTFTNALLPAVTSVPTLSEWAMIMLAGLMAIAGFAALRRKGM